MAVGGENEFAAALGDVFGNVQSRVGSHAAVSCDSSGVYLERHFELQQLVCGCLPCLNISRVFRRKQAVVLVELGHKIKMPDERRIYFLSELRDIFIIRLRKAYKRAAEIFVDIVDLVLCRRLVNGNINISRLHIVNRTDRVVELRQISLVCVKICLKTDVYSDLVRVFFAQGFELVYISARLVRRHAV